MPTSGFSLVRHFTIVMRNVLQWRHKFSAGGLCKPCSSLEMEPGLPSDPTGNHHFHKGCRGFGHASWEEIDPPETQFTHVFIFPWHIMKEEFLLSFSVTWTKTTGGYTIKQKYKVDVRGGDYHIRRELFGVSDISICHGRGGENVRQTSTQLKDKSI